MTKRSRRYFKIKAFYKILPSSNYGWLCSCGHFEHSEFHCSSCGWRQPPMGCDCSVCREDYDEDDYDFSDDSLEECNGQFTIYDYIYPKMEPMKDGQINPFIDADDLPF